MLAGIAIIVLIGLVGGGVNLLVPLQLRENGVSAGEIGLLFSVASAVYTVVSAVVARLGHARRRSASGASRPSLTGLSIFLVLGSSGSTLAAVAFVLLRAPPWSTMDTIIYPLAAAGAHRSALGRGSVMGLADLGWAAASTVGPLLAGGIADAARERAAYAVLIVFCAAVGALAAAAPLARRAVDLDRLYGARDLDELRAEYDRIASAYDAELVDGMGYRSPAAVTAVARRLLPARGANPRRGRGHRSPRRRPRRTPASRGSTASTSRRGCSPRRERKKVYGDLREGRLGDELDYASGSFDGVVSAGVLTSGHAPAGSLDELVRITRSGRPRDLHAALGSGPARVRRQDRRARARGTLGARRARRRVPGAAGRGARGARPRLGLPRPLGGSQAKRRRGLAVRARWRVSKT